MVKKGVLLLILLTLFLSAFLENSYAKNRPIRIDEQDEMHPWGGDDNNNTGVIQADPYNPISYGDYSLRSNYGSKTNLISGVWRIVLNEIRSIVYGYRGTARHPRERSAGPPPTSSTFTQPDSGPSGGRSGS